jgi:hypothetical protein
MGENAHYPTRIRFDSRPAITSRSSEKVLCGEVQYSWLTSTILPNAPVLHEAAPEIRCSTGLPPMGAHIISPRVGYLHHGIYVGRGKVIHYAGLGRSMLRGPVEEVSIAEFARGRPVSIRSDAPPRYDQGEIIRRARSRIGEDLYRLWTNNCEHFCEWCLRGEHRSYQVELWVRRAESLLGATFSWRRSRERDTGPRGRRRFQLQPENNRDDYVNDCRL